MVFCYSSQAKTGRLHHLRSGCKWPPKVMQMSTAQLLVKLREATTSMDQWYTSNRKYKTEVELLFQTRLKQVPCHVQMCTYKNIGIANFLKINNDITVTAAAFKGKCLKRHKLDLNKYRAILRLTCSQHTLETLLSHKMRTRLQGQMWSPREACEERDQLWDFARS